MIDTGKIHLYRSALVDFSDVESRNYALGAACRGRFFCAEKFQVGKRKGWNVICVGYPIQLRWQDAEGSGTCRVSGPEEVRATARCTLLR